MDAHPNIEIRIFNPLANRKFRNLNFITDFDRVNHRMHNKTMVMDNAVAIIGGRNIGNHYFGVATDANFRDLDIAAAGPVVREISQVYDHFWNGNWAVPVEALLDKGYTEADLQVLMATLREQIVAGSYPYPLDEDIAALQSRLLAVRDNFVWAHGKIVWNDPADIKAGEEHGDMIKALLRKLQVTHRELLIESAYFVPRERGIAALKALQDRGVSIRVLTNSLASNDVVAAHAGHAKYRKELIANGTELYEMRPDAGVIKKNVLAGSSKAALHTKAMVFDRESLFIGSFNLDPRSANINTEAGLYVESPTLAKRVIAYMDEGVQPENSYRVVLDENGRLVWITREDGQEVRYTRDPESGAWARMMSGFIQVLPVEAQL
jgi:putative cardiolipin synthase